MTDSGGAPRRPGGHDGQPTGDPEDTGIMPTVQAVDIDDAFLTALSEGSASATGSGAYGTDAFLAEGLRSLSSELSEDMPPVPELPADFGADNVTALPSVENRDEPEETAQPQRKAKVISLRDRFTPGRLGSAAMGAVAASVMLFGGVGLIQAAEPDSALWPVRKAMMGEQTVDVQLASALASADDAANDGDMDRANELLAMAERLLLQVHAEDRGRFEEQVRSSAERIREVEVEVTRTVRDTTTSVITSTDRPSTVTREVTLTETQTQTQTQTTTVTPPPGNGGDGGGSLEPSEPQPDSAGE